MGSPQARLKRTAAQRALGAVGAMVLASAGLTPSLAANAQADLRHARDTYLLHCSGCHQPDGRGKPSAGIPDMRETAPLLLATPAGRAFLIQVPGTSASALSNSEIAGLMNWLLPALSGRSDLKPFSAEEVASYRSQPLDDVSAHRAAILGTGAGGLPYASPGRRSDVTD
ncbi:cytochrome c [Cupriavidus basilensis]|uniref:Cytochrome c n=1 Tax=Cupriavidus basilensis TaxID=68895 RepID=A0ABT6B4Y6_9BURK|nr:cytochrome c [Cupriavidus basilensis]MDF3839947.1 cytochrome c [Cupriavidus basilensis]